MYIYIEKIHCTSSQVQSWNMQVFHRDYQDRNHKSVRHSACGAKAPQVRLTWIRVCHRQSAWSAFGTDPKHTSEWDSISVFLSSVLLNHRAQAGGWKQPGPVKDAPEPARARWEGTVDGDLMSSFRTHVPIIRFQGNISVKTVPSLIYCCKCWHIAGYNLYAAGVWFTLFTVFVLSKSPREAYMQDTVLFMI